MMTGYQGEEIYQCEDSMEYIEGDLNARHEHETDSLGTGAKVTETRPGLIPLLA